jgi:dolichol-phosphate mannosyltransferase
MHEICVVAPIYNEEQTISEFVKQVTNTLSQISIDYEIILIDDGSKDSSWGKIKKEVVSNSKVRGIKLSRNFGHHYAISAGLHKANAKWTVVMDSDLQDRPDVIKDLYSKAKEGYEVVFVSRINRPESFGYLFLQKLFYKLLNLFSGLKFNSRQANFSIIEDKVVNAFRQFPENSRFYGATIKWLGFKRTQIYADHGVRFSGQPSYTYKKRIKLATDIILSFSERPLKFAIILGMLTSISSIFSTFWIVYAKITRGYEVQGWTSLILTTLFFSGVILIILGILGIYLGRVFQEVKKRPLYIVCDKINFRIDQNEIA